MKIRTDIDNYFWNSRSFVLFLFPNIEIFYRSNKLTLTLNILFWSFTISFDWGKEEKK